MSRSVVALFHLVSIYQRDNWSLLQPHTSNFQTCIQQTSWIGAEIQNIALHLLFFQCLYGATHLSWSSISKFGQTNVTYLSFFCCLGPVSYRMDLNICTNKLKSAGLMTSLNCE